MNPRFSRLLAGTLIFSFIAVGFATHATAQDIIISNPEILPSDNTPDTPPAFKRAWEIPVPDALKQTDKFSYVIITQYIDKDGRRIIPRVNGVSSDLAKSFRQSEKPPEFKPARLQGKPVGTYARITGIFNPASASPKAKDAIPRVLAIAPVVIAKQQIDEMKAAKKSLMLIADAQIDETGAIAGYTFAPESKHAADFKSEIDAALALWKFAPARTAGKAVASTLSIPLILVSKQSESASALLSIPPISIKRVPPIYPYSMKRSGLIGEVTVSFEVNQKGDVQNPFVVKSNNPGFEAAAIEAVRKWKFKPGIKNGQPVTTKMQIPITFNLDGSGRDAYSIDKPSKRTQARMPENLRYDTPPKITDVIEPIYPYELALSRTAGKATVAMFIDKKGRVTNVQVIEASHLEFGLASVAAAERYQFTPATLDGKPVDSVIKREFEFNAVWLNGLTQSDLDMISLEKKKSDKIVSASKLDQVLKPLSQRPPVFPLAVAPGATGGEATVTFLIDTEGKVRLPRFNAATEPAFGYAAVQAVAHWRFEPATQNGKKVITRVQVPVNFSTNPPARK